jgi:hypothetical protein
MRVKASSPSNDPHGEIRHDNREILFVGTHGVNANPPFMALITW